MSLDQYFSNLRAQLADADGSFVLVRDHAASCSSANNSLSSSSHHRNTASGGRRQRTSFDESPEISQLPPSCPRRSASREYSSTNSTSNNKGLEHDDHRHDNDDLVGHTIDKALCLIDGSDPDDDDDDDDDFFVDQDRFYDALRPIKTKSGGAIYSFGGSKKQQTSMPPIVPQRKVSIEPSSPSLLYR